MSTNFPSSIDDGTTLPNPSSTDKTNSPSHASLHGNANDAIKAIEAKLGSGATTPSASKILFGTGAGTSDWKELTSAELKGVISDETGSGSAVFATSPTLVTPSVDTINESTPANGVTIDGLNIKDSKLNTNNSVVTANITNASVTADKLATGAAKSTVATSETTTSTSYTDLATVESTTVTVGANGLLLVGYSCQLSNSGANGCYAAPALSGATTYAASDNDLVYHVGTSAEAHGRVKLFTGLTPGSTTATLKFKVDGGTGTFLRREIWAVPL